MDELQARWAALLGSLPLGPGSLASHPSAQPQLSEAARLPGVGRRGSDAVARTAVSLAFLRDLHHVCERDAANCGISNGDDYSSPLRFFRPLLAQQLLQLPLLQHAQACVAQHARELIWLQQQQLRRHVTASLLERCGEAL